MSTREEPPAPERLAAELEASFQAQCLPNFEGRDAAHWVEAVTYLLHDGRMDAGEYALRHLRAKFSDVRCAGRLGAVFDSLPVNGAPLPFEDDATKDVQVVARDGAETVMLLFCGRANKIGLPINLMHRWTGRLNASLIYLRDFRNLVYLGGIQSLGSTREAAVAQLRGIIASLGARRIVCYGNSAGVFGALHYGLDLGAEAIACVGGAINFSPEFNAYMTLEQRAMNLHAEFPNAVLDPRELYAGAHQPPGVRIVYGGDYWNDRIHAEHMGSLPCVTLHPLEGFDGHNAITELIVRGQFEDLLCWLVPPSSQRVQQVDEADGGAAFHRHSPGDALNSA